MGKGANAVFWELFPTTKHTGQKWVCTFLFGYLKIHKKSLFILIRIRLELEISLPNISIKIILFPAMYCSLMKLLKNRPNIAEEKIWLRMEKSLKIDYEIWYAYRIISTLHKCSYIGSVNFVIMYSMIGWFYSIKHIETIQFRIISML